MAGCTLLSFARSQFLTPTFLVHPPPLVSVVMATDQSNARSILLYQTNLDKVIPMTSHSFMGASGPNCDVVNFSEYIAKNIKLYELCNDTNTKLSIAAQANFARTELATALRKGPYQVNLLYGGYDPKLQQSALYFLDYLATLQPVSFGAHGYASNFCLSIMDRDYPADVTACTEEMAIDMIRKCIHELHVRFLISQPNFMIKVVDANGIRTIEHGADPSDT
jgi:20S proteasome subunit beta 4